MMHCHGVWSIGRTSYGKKVTFALLAATGLRAILQLVKGNAELEIFRGEGFSSGAYRGWLRSQPFLIWIVANTSPYSQSVIRNSVRNLESGISCNLHALPVILRMEATSSWRVKTFRSSNCSTNPHQTDSRMGPPCSGSNAEAFWNACNSSSGDRAAFSI